MSKYNAGFKTLLQEDHFEPEFCRDNFFDVYDSINSERMLEKRIFFF